MTSAVPEPDGGSLESRLSLVQKMLDQAAAELAEVMDQLRGEDPGGK